MTNMTYVDSDNSYLTLWHSQTLELKRSPLDLINYYKVSNEPNKQFLTIQKLFAVRVTKDGVTKHTKEWDQIQPTK